MLLIAGLVFMTAAFFELLVSFSGSAEPSLITYALMVAQAIWGATLVVRHVNR